MTENAVITFSEVKDLAAAVAKSALFQAFRSPEQALVLMMMAQAEGIHPIQAMQRYDVIDGKPAMKSTAVLASYLKNQGTIEYVTMTDAECTAIFRCPGLTQPMSITWTIDMAKKAGLTGKKNWLSYPRAMLRARVLAEGVRAAMPGVLGGLYSESEVQDFDTKPVNVTPAKHADAILAACKTSTDTLIGPVVDAEIVEPKSPAQLYVDKVGMPKRDTTGDVPFEPPPPVEPPPEKEPVKPRGYLHHITDEGTRNEIMALILIYMERDKTITKKVVNAVLADLFRDSQGNIEVFAHTAKDRFTIKIKGETP